MDLVKRLYWFVSDQFGVDVRRFARFIMGIPRYVRDWRRFRRSYSGQLSLVPCLQDWHAAGGSVGTEYFLQDLFVAQKIFQAGPEKHVDVGSRMDGFAAHVASFREIEVFDIRPVHSTLPGIVFHQADLMNADDLPEGHCDSLSCLHALEHFGLGRYGDPLDVNGHEKGLRNMARLLKSGGTFYLSVPVGKARLEFNAQRIFNPLDLVRLASDNGLTLEGFASVRQGGSLQEADEAEREMAALQNVRYALGIFTFVKQ